MQPCKSWRSVTCILETLKRTSGKRRYVGVCVRMHALYWLLHLKGDQLRVMGLFSISVLGQMTQSSAPPGKRQAAGNSEEGWLVFVCTVIHLLPTLSKCSLIIFPLTQASPAPKPHMLPPS